MIRPLLLACLAWFALQAQAGDWPQLKLSAEHAVDGMRGGNLSGLAWCRGALWAVSDRDDDRIYRLDQAGATWQAQPLTFTAPAAPDTGLPWGLRSRTWAASYIRGGALDFEGITCDQAGNLYVVSEAHAAVLQLPVEGEPDWLKIDQAMVRQARASGMLLHFNALFEGWRSTRRATACGWPPSASAGACSRCSASNRCGPAGAAACCSARRVSRCSRRNSPRHARYHVTLRTWPGSKASCSPSSAMPTAFADEMPTQAPWSAVGRSPPTP